MKKVTKKDKKSQTSEKKVTNYWEKEQTTEKSHKLVKKVIKLWKKKSQTSEKKIQKSLKSGERG